MKRYTSPKAKVVYGKDFGFAAIDRLSTIFVKSAQRIDWHRHEEVEVLCCLKGSLDYEFRALPPITLSAGCFLVIPPLLEHRLNGGIDGPCRRFSLFLRQPHAKRASSTPVSTPEMRELLSFLLRKRLRPHAIGGDALPLIVRMANFMESGATPSLIDLLALRSDSLATAITLARTKRDQAFKPEMRLMREATQWLERHFAERITMEQLVAYMGYSRSRFFSLFKAHTGQSPVEWLTLYRIDRARQRLLMSADGINDVARSCGFPDPSFFARVFHRRIGCSPTEFRKLAATPPTANGKETE